MRARRAERGSPRRGRTGPGPAVVVTGGGTGGHVMPALAVARAVLERWPGARVVYVGTRDGLEASLVPAAGIEFSTVPAGRIVGRRPREMALGLGRALAGVRQARRLLRTVRPDVVVGTGGFVAGPVVLAALTLRIPCLLQEQNARPGFTNRVLAPWVARVAVPFDTAREGFGRRARVVVTGNPVRPEVLSARREDALAAFGLDPDRRTVLVVGGSLGARTINQATQGMAPGLLKRGDAQLLWSTGARFYDEVVAGLRQRGVGGAPGLKVFAYIERMDLALAAADLAVARPSGMTLAELCARGVPAVLVPSPNVAADHQTPNAAVLVDAGAAVAIPDRECTADKLGEVVGSLLDRPGTLSRMAEAGRRLGRPDATDRLVDLVAELAGRKV